MSCVRANGQLSDSFTVASGVRQGCVLTPDAFNTGLHSTLEIFDLEAAPLGLSVNWKKTKIQSLSNFGPDIPDLVIHGDTVEAVEEFVYLGAKVSRSYRSSPEISRRIGMTHQAMKYLYGTSQSGILS